MRIDGITSISPFGKVSKLDSVSTAADETKKAESATFSETVKKALDNVSELQKTSEEMSVRLARGEVEDVHQVMLAVQRAKLSMDFTMAVRNKVIDAYHEIMRMQV